LFINGHITFYWSHSLPHTAIQKQDCERFCDDFVPVKINRVGNIAFINVAASGLCDQSHTHLHRIGMEVGRLVMMTTHTDPCHNGESSLLLTTCLPHKTSLVVR
jgi:hypothetical protein